MVGGVVYIKTHEVRQKSKDHVLGWLRWLYAQFGAVCHSNKSLSRLTGYPPQYIKTVLHQFLADGVIEQDTWTQTRQNRAGWEYFQSSAPHPPKVGSFHRRTGPTITMVGGL